MRSRKISGRLPWNLYEHALRRCREEGYKNFMRYVCGVILRDIIAPQRHLVIRAVADAEPDTQDAMFRVFLDATPEQFREIMQRVAAEMQRWCGESNRRAK